ncbi:DEAD/DEAH box helicase [Actinosynnema pretiosum subsp. pretiosum]|uniref:DEAD/DEAH box helicase n=1 Tax=Actinosynnema pretiosum subsp. pretiosum TaxID=103721 RepID=A0AA45L714_9PSEU|nr:Helicase domain protein [Actinosynnema pretiosum subsp. pretiosum]QUF04253.1 DEAD/DEAH box helicase [Actinosynnema pretiosum subsp. pretiosum]
MNSRPSGSDRDSAQFLRLHEKVQRWVYRKGWTALNDVQEQAIPLVLGGTEDLIVSAATASGKTEAAFLPICSAMLDEPAGGGIRALYVSPLKALINDQHRRLDELCEDLELPVHRWHGDVPGSAKSKVLKEPDGTLLITPESLEAMFVLRGPEIGRLLSGLRWVVIDEMHSFVGTERGAQLQSLLHRVELAVRRRVPRIGLSATLPASGAGMASARDYLRPGGGDGVHVLTSQSQGAEIRVQLRGYVDAAPAAGSGRTPFEHWSDERGDGSEEDSEGNGATLVSEHVFATLRGGNNLVFFDSRSQVEGYADRLRRRSEQHGVPNEFFPHHGNLAKDVREHVEDLLKSNRPVTVLCTSTLEMGIDIGAIASVAQIGAPPSVAGLRQRIGRAGRRGEPAVLRLYVTAPEITEKSAPQDELRVELFQAVAMMDLLAERWYEPPDTSALHLSTLVQQIMSVIAQHQGVSPLDLFGALCATGPFSHVDKGDFVVLLRDLGAAGIVQQEPDGLLLLGPVGERIVDHFSFYAVFADSSDYRVVHGARPLGLMQLTAPTPIGSLVIFAGRRWKILSVDDRAKLIEVEPSSGGRPPKFFGGNAEIHDEVRRRMRVWYESDVVPRYLDATAQRLLDEGRAAYRRFDLARTPFLASGADTVVFPWRGDRILGTIAAWLTTAGLRLLKDGVAFTVSDHGPARLREVVQELLLVEGPTAEDIAAAQPDTVVEKHDVHLGESLRTRAYAAGRLDLDGARATLVDLVDQLPECEEDPISGVVAVPAPLRPATLPDPSTPLSEGGTSAVAAPPATYAVVDLETTGFSARGRDRVVEVAVIRMAADGAVLGEWSSLVNPQRRVSATGVHGITDDEVVDAPTFADLAPTLAAHLRGAVLVAHNASFDVNFLKAEFERAQHPYPSGSTLCTMQLDARVAGRGRRRLQECLAEVDAVSASSTSHRALADARAAAALLRHYLATAPREVRKNVVR